MSWSQASRITTAIVLHDRVDHRGKTDLFSIFAYLTVQSIAYDTCVVPTDKPRSCFDDLLCKGKREFSARLCAACLQGNGIKGVGINQFQCRLTWDN